MTLDLPVILDRLGFKALTPMQQAMQVAGSRRGGIVLLSPTGTGKTLAYLLPLIERIDPLDNSLQVVVIVPTRELAAQSEEVLRRMKLDVRQLSLYGGRPAMKEHTLIKEVRPQVVFATPGRLCDHLRKGNLSPEAVRLVVVDEFDKCLELGFQDEMSEALGAFASLDSLWLTSATDADRIPGFVRQAMGHEGYTLLDYLTIAPRTVGDRLAVKVATSPRKDKLETLGHLLTLLKGAPAIVFVSHRESVERISNFLRSAGFAVVAYHGGMEQTDRERALYKFRGGAANVLVSTDLASRGIDIPEVRAVIHYHLPLKAEEYVHRNGRTARWEADGTICLILGPEEQLPAWVSAGYERITLDEEIPFRPVAPAYVMLYIGRGKRDKLSRGDVLGFLCKKGGLQASQIGRIDIEASSAYAAVECNAVRPMIARIKGEKIKGMKTIIEVSKR